MSREKELSDWVLARFAELGLSVTDLPFVAMDADGEVTAYADEPVLAGRMWDIVEGMEYEYVGYLPEELKVFPFEEFLLKWGDVVDRIDKVDGGDLGEGLTSAGAHVMIDLETLGTKPGSVILSIGAVAFLDGKIVSRFYERIDAVSSVQCGLTIDPATVMWWLQQSDVARAELVKEGKSLLEVLVFFSEWISAFGAQVRVWGNGAAFDNVLLAAAYDMALLQRPWEFWNDRCYRTMKGMFPKVPFVRMGVHHNALADAESQAEHLLKIFKTIDGGDA